MRPSRKEPGNRPFDAKEDGPFLAKYFNLATTEPRMRSLVEPLQRIVLQLRAMTDEVSRTWAAVQPGVKYSASAHAEWEEKQRRFNALLEPHGFYLYLSGWTEKDGKAVPVFCDMPTGTKTTKVFQLIQLARKGLLERLRTCVQCGIWFFAGTPWAECCSKKCKKKKNDSKPGAKEKHNIQARYSYRKTASPHHEYYQKGFSPAEVRALLRKRKHRLKGKIHGKKR